MEFSEAKGSLGLMPMKGTATGADLQNKVKEEMQILDFPMQKLA
jgi:hypothetical protein